MPEGIDHAVHAVRDLDAAADFYTRAGFAVGARNRHPWGTHNRIVQLKDFYIELLEVAEPAKIVPGTNGSFSFGAFHQDFLKLRQGLSMLLLKSSDAKADADRFRASGIGRSKVFDFAREGVGPDGAPVKLAFSLAFASDPVSPNLAFAVCQHHFPENFWNPASQTHANRARTVLGAVMVSDAPVDHQNFLQAFTGSPTNSSSTGVTARTGNGAIEVTNPTSFRNQFGVSPAVVGEGMMFNGLRIRVDDIAQVEALLARDGITSQRQMDRLIVAPDVAYGATLIFEVA
jgi:glyoxalase-like protein